MIEAYNQVGGNMVALMEVSPEQTSSYGAVKPGDVTGRLVEVRGLVEKPKVTEAPSKLAVIGRYILQANVLEDLPQMGQAAGGESPLTAALARLPGPRRCRGHQL